MVKISKLGDVVENKRSNFSFCDLIGHQTRTIKTSLKEDCQESISIKISWNPSCSLGEAT